MCAFEEAKEVEVEQQNTLRAEAEEDLRLVKQNAAIELTRLQNEKQVLLTEKVFSSLLFSSLLLSSLFFKGVITNEFNTQKNLLLTEVESLKAELKLKSEELEKEVNKLRNQKQLLSKQQQGMLTQRGVD